MQSCYVGKLANLYASDPWQAALCDEAMEAVKDINGKDLFDHVPSGGAKGNAAQSVSRRLNPLLSHPITAAA
jgi:hypothetical protein